MVREDGAERAYLLTLIENLQREDLSPREEADALAELVRTRKWSTRQVADAIKRSQAFVSKRLRVFDDPLLQAGPARESSECVGGGGAPVTWRRAAAAVLEEALASNWDQAAVRAAVRRELGQARPPPAQPEASNAGRKPAHAVARDPYPADLAEVDRNALRRLFADLALLARAPSAPAARFRQPLPEVPRSTRRRRT